MMPEPSARDHSDQPCFSRDLDVVSGVGDEFGRRGILIVRYLTKPLWTLLALVFLLEAWLWDTLGPIVARLVAALHLERLGEVVRAGVGRLSPWATLPVFLLPGLVLTPFKLTAVWLLANGHPFLGVATFLLAKTVGLGVTAFLFDVCRPNLMRMAWFVRVYDWVLRAKDWAHLQADPYIRRGREAAAEARAWIVARMPKGRLGRRLRRLRHRSQRV